MHLKELVSLCGVSGNEGCVRAFIRQKLEGRCDTLTTDSMGNLICLIRGTGVQPKKLMVCAHMDEVGLIVSRITDEGFLKFKTVGGIDPRVLVSKRVLVGEKQQPGVIGYKAVHLQTASEREMTAKSKNLFIDIGAKTKKEAEKKAEIGDYIAFDSDYREFGANLVKARALDDRAGCDILMSLADCRYPFDLYLVFTVQEEVGLRGAKIAAYQIEPDAALVVETTTCSDVAGTEPKDRATVLGSGAAVSVIDRGTLYDRRLTNELFRLAEQHSIPVQYKKTAMGGNDAGEIHLSRGGVPTAAVSIPARYIHSPSSVISLNDYWAVKNLVKTFLEDGRLF